ncbi:MAG: thioredoxin domain-containing protein [Campylobacterales bacterium]|nr:thioredoxin domain-containing protein [Campylobacterales bacterium]
MLKLLATTLLLSSALFATVENKKVEKFLEESFKNNPNILSLKVTVADKMPLEQLKGWESLVVEIEATVKTKTENKVVKQKMIWFTNGDVITKELTDLKTGNEFKDLVSPSFKNEYYKKENLIYGNANAKHKVVIFSDPLCPFCRDFVPKTIEEMRSQPEKFAIYYFHFPLPSLHPAAVELSLAATAAELQGNKDVILNLYKVEIDPNERDITKILAAFNKTMKTDIKEADIKSDTVMNHNKQDLEIAEEVMVQGTPTLFFDGKIDKTKKLYKKAL